MEHWAGVVSLCICGKWHYFSNKEKFSHEGKVQLKSDIGGLFRNMFLTASLRSPLKFKAPRVVSSVPETITMDEIKKYFAKNSVDFKKLLQDLPAELEDKFIFKHPRAGLFSIDHTINFTREHYLHHERQLNALL